MRFPFTFFGPKPEPIVPLSERDARLRAWLQSEDYTLFKGWMEERMGDHNQNLLNTKDVMLVDLIAEDRSIIECLETLLKPRPTPDE